MKPKALILHATGTNRDLDAAQALELAGAKAEIVHLNQLRQKERSWTDYQLLILPGGFSYADALGAGRLLALDLTVYFAEEVRTFVESGKPVIGICNGFQALVKSGILPGGRPGRNTGNTYKLSETLQATLTFNASGHFECRWVTMKPVSQTCIWTHSLAELIYCPVAHGEGSLDGDVDPADHRSLFADKAHDWAKRHRGYLRPEWGRLQRRARPGWSAGYLPDQHADIRQGRISRGYPWPLAGRA